MPVEPTAERLAEGGETETGRHGLIVAQNESPPISRARYVANVVGASLRTGRADAAGSTLTADDEYSGRETP